MGDDREYLSLLRRKAEQILRKSPGMEGMSATEMPGADPATATLARPETASLEAVVRWYRPVLAVTDDRFVTSSRSPDGDPRFQDPNEAASKALLAELEKRRSVLDPVIRSVGRIELVNNVRYPWVGTGWIVGSDLGSDIIVTNAHVGSEFGARSGAGYVFRPGVPDGSVRQSARIDFREEVTGGSAREFPITEIIWISGDDSLDMCLLRVARTAGTDRIDPPVKLFTAPLSDDQMVAVIGFPGSNNGYDPAPFQKLFGAVTGKKRFSPGFYSGRRGSSATYDCSTLPGSSGSVVVDVTTGRAVGLHFAGTAFDTNYAVPASDLARILLKRPWQTEAAARSADTTRAAPPAAPRDAAQLPAPALASALASDGAITFSIPLEISVRLGGLARTISAASVDPPVVRADQAPPRRTDREAATAAAETVRQHLLGQTDVLSVKADYLFSNGVITDDFGVIVGVAPGTTIDPASFDLKSTQDGVAIAVETADPRTIAEQRLAFDTESFAGRQANYQRDRTDPRFNLDPVTDDMTILLHVSPEAGWPVLRQFLGDKDSNQLTIGMYHMTAPHVVEAIEAIAQRGDSKIVLTLDRQRGDADIPDDIGGDTKAQDIPEADTLDNLSDIAETRFAWAPASLGRGGLFPTAYHIKVAVWSATSGRDGPTDRMFWLSSGNWQSSNQAPIERSVDEIGEVTQDEVQRYNREWHALVTHAGLAATFRNHLEQDFEDNRAAAEQEAPQPVMPEVLVPLGLIEEAPRARAFKPFKPKLLKGRIKVQPLLTPDNYPEVIVELISKAKHRVLIENQSFSLWKDIASTPAHFLDIVKAVKDRQNKIRDVRVIFRSGFGNERDTLRQMKTFGLETDADHVRYFDKCHTKGIVIDDDIAVLGSQNWTAAGTGPNRDASLVIWNADANAYFAELFQYDWDQVARNRSRSTESTLPIKVVRAGEEAGTPRGYSRISLAEFLGET
ncbi:phospholipase D-like domain-containing protein [Rhodopseudomonas palustris]|uniref:Phospholipase D n=1 Tax=Rhodopseudomonas palustris (strain BisB18) TaxID=316056 RepID=Q211I3_RHOPB